jgi:deoxyribonuclease-4
LCYNGIGDVILYIGSHVGFNKNTQLVGSLQEALSYGANTFMFYTGAPQNTKRFEIDKSITELAKQKMLENNIDINNIIVHAPYIVNLANNQNKTQYDFSINFIINECKRCEKLGVKYLVLHPGNHVGLGVEIGIKNIIHALNIILDKTTTTILLETMAGKGSEIGSNFDELKEIIDGIKFKEKIGVCLDTCHLFDSGYDISDFDNVLDEFDKEIGLNYLKCIHINDSKNTLGSRKDRHENIGFGTIGFDNLINIIYNKRLEDIPKILETPYITKNDTSKEREYPPYKYEIDMIKNKTFNSDMINKIRTINE